MIAYPIFNDWEQKNEELISSCFKTYLNIFNKPETFSDKDLIDLMLADEVFERFVFLHATYTYGLGPYEQNGSFKSKAPLLHNYRFFKIIEYGALQNDNLFGFFLGEFKYHCNNSYLIGSNGDPSREKNLLDEKICNESKKFFSRNLNLKNNKYFQLFRTYSNTGVSGDIESALSQADEFFKKYSIDDFHELFFKYVFNYRKTWHLEDINDPRPEKNNLKFLETNFGLPSNYLSSIKLSYIQQVEFIYSRTNRQYLAKNYEKEIASALGIDYSNFIKDFDFPKHFSKQNDGHLLSVGLDLINSILMNTQDQEFFKEAYKKTYHIRTSNNQGFTHYGLARQHIYFGDYREAYNIYSFNNSDRVDRYIKPYSPNVNDAKNLIIDSVSITHYLYASLSATETNNINDAEVALKNAKTAFDIYPKGSKFLELLMMLAELKLAIKKDEFVQSRDLYNSLTNEINNSRDYEFGYFLNEDADYFVHEYITSFRLLSKLFNNLEVPIHIYNFKDKLYSEYKFTNLKFSENQIQLNKLITDYKEIKKEISLNDAYLLETGNSENLTKLTNLSNQLYERLENTKSKIFSLKKSLVKYYEGGNASLTQIQNRLGNDSLIFYSFSSFKSIVLHVTKDTYSYYDINKSGEEIYDIVSKFTESLRISSADLQYDYDLGIKLNKILFSPLKIKKNSAVYVYQNEIINNLAFSALPNNNPDESDQWKKLIKTSWLGDDYSFAKILSLNIEKTEHNYKKNFVGFGDPIITSELILKSLPLTENELIDIAIASNGAPDDVFLSHEANIDNFFAQLDDKPKVLVLGTHGFAADSFDGIRESSILFSPKDGKYLLTASEIAQLDINSDWVVVASCDSGFNENYYLRSDTSLAKAFLSAGANSVLVSNWNLESSASKQLTNRIFKNLWYDKDLNKHDALQKASKELRKDLSNRFFAHPSYWSVYSIAYNSL